MEICMKACIKYENGIAKVIINGKEFLFSAYRTWRPKEENYKRFAEVGFPFITLLPGGIKSRLGLPYSEYGEYWLGEGIYDWDVLRRQTDLAIKSAPDAYIIMNLMLDTRDWFLKEHPECLDTFLYFTSVAGWEVWRKSAERMLKDTIDFFEKEYPEKVFCIFLSAGATCEWRNLKLDLPPCEIREQTYREYTKNPDARVPTEEEIASCSHGSFRDVRNNKKAIDFLRFNNEIVTDTISYFAKVVKRHTDGRLLVGAAAGYPIVAEFPLSGHSATADVVNIPELDVMIAPASYIHRFPDGVSASQAAQDSIRLHNKLIVTSIDNKTYASRTNVYAQALEHVEHESMEQSLNYVRREAALALSKGSGFWIFDMYGVNYPEEWHKKELGKIREAAEEVLKGKVEYNAEVAVLYDPRSYLYTTAGWTVKNENVMPEITELGRIGCPIDHYSIDDILFENFPEKQYKLYLLPNCIAPSEKIRGKIKKLRKSASFIFSGHAGCVKDGEFSLSFSKELTGIDITEADCRDYYTAVDKEFNDLGYDKDYKQCTGEIYPLLKCCDDTATVMGRNIIDGSEKLVIKEREGGFDVWSARGAIPESVLRPLAKRAGVFIYQSEGLPTYANSRMAAFYDHKGGKRLLRFPTPCGLKEYYSGEEYRYDGGELEVEFEPDRLKLFIIQKDS